MFWEAVAHMAQEERELMLKFVTGRSRLPVQVTYLVPHRIGIENVVLNKVRLARPAEGRHRLDQQQRLLSGIAHLLPADHTPAVPGLEDDDDSHQHRFRQLRLCLRLACVRNNRRNAHPQPGRLPVHPFHVHFDPTAPGLPIYKKFL